VRLYLRWYFLGFYAVAVLILLVTVLPPALRAEPAEKRPAGLRRFLPVVLLPLGFLVPPGLMLLREAEIDADWTAIRLLGLTLGVYAAVVLPWSAATLGRFLVPQARVSRDHALVMRGPFRFVRHPAYSGDLALWLGSALATLNVALLALWPLYLAGARAEADVEEELLESKFGDAYRRWAHTAGRFLPRIAR